MLHWLYNFPLIQLKALLPGLYRTIALRQPTSVLSIFISLILATNSVNTRSNMVPTPAWWALLLWTCKPVANNIPSFTTVDLCENAAINSSFQPEIKKIIYYSLCYEKLLQSGARVMAFNATFNNISVITWWSFLLVEETRVPRENPLTCHKSLTNFVVSSIHRNERWLIA